MNERISKGEPHYYIPQAMVAAAQGDTESMLEWLEKAHVDTEFALAYFLNVDPMFKQHAELPRLAAIRKDLQLN